MKKNTCGEGIESSSASSQKPLGVWNPVKCLIEAVPLAGVLGRTNFANEVKYAFLDDLMREKKSAAPTLMQTPRVCLKSLRADDQLSSL